MIVKRSVEMPSEWTTSAIMALIDHANDLAANGNPAGFLVSDGLHEVQPTWPFTEEEFSRCRAWIEANTNLVHTALQYEVRSDP